MKELLPRISREGKNVAETPSKWSDFDWVEAWRLDVVKQENARLVLRIRVLQEAMARAAAYLETRGVNSDPYARFAHSAIMDELQKDEGRL